MRHSVDQHHAHVQLHRPDAEIINLFIRWVIHGRSVVPFAGIRVMSPLEDELVNGSGSRGSLSNGPTGSPRCHQHNPNDADQLAPHGWILKSHSYFPSFVTITGFTITPFH